MNIQSQRGRLKEKALWLFNEKFNIILILALVIIFVALLAGFCKGHFQVERTNYEGTIVDRWAGYSESEAGSKPYYRLRIRDEGGQEFTVRVDNDTYMRSRVGMWIRKDGAKIIVQPEPSPVRPGK
jgi:hypothetical protein